MAERSRRRLSFPSAHYPREQSTSCALCLGQHKQLSEPRTWKSVHAQQLALSLNVGLDQSVCRPCRDDITRLTNNPSHQPRWAKQTESTCKCCIPGCNEAVFAQSRVASSEEIRSILGCSTLGDLPVPTPLCKHHYHLVYDTLQPKQTHCPTCGSSLRTTTARPCSDPQYIQQYLAEKTGFEGEIPEGAKVCFSCYKSHLQMLKAVKEVSTDSDLSTLINSLKHSLPVVDKATTVDDIVNKAMQQTSILVGETLLRQEALLLPSVHDSFSTFVTEASHAANLHLGGETKHLVTARWLLSNLMATLQHHLSYACRVTKLGTLLYRTNGDLLTSLTLSLHKLSRSPQVNSDSHSSQNPNPLTFPETHMNEVVDDLNCRIHQQIRRYLAADTTTPYRFDQVDIDNLISEMDPTLWSFITLLTRSISERRGTSKVSNQTTLTHHVKKVRRFFGLCSLMFCTDDRCYLPVHNLMTDTVESLGGSTQLIRILNRLGVCSSADTLARSIQYRVQERDQRGPELECSPHSLTVVSADNIDFLHSYARVFCGNQTSSWHGTTVQAVQPKPSLHSATISTSLSDRVGDTVMQTEPPRSSTQGQSTHALPTRDNREHTECISLDSPLTLAGRKRATGELSPYTSPSKTCRSPAPKVRRRARTGIEERSGVVEEPPVLTPPASRSSVHTCLDNVDQQSFEVSQSEESALKILKCELNTYILQKHAHSCNRNKATTQPVLNIQDYMRVTRPTEPERSNVVYLQVVDALSESKDTLMQILQDLHHRFVERQNKEWVVVSGDAKVYEVLQSLKYEYGAELKWLLLYPGDWHLLKNYAIALMKPYFDTGLKELARASGYPVAAIQSCSQFKRTHHFLLEVWEAFYRVMVDRFLESSGNTTNSSHSPEVIMETVRNAYLQLSCGEEPDLSTTISRLQEALNKSGYHTAFADFLDRLSATDSTWKFWVQFVFQDALAYISLYLSIRSGNWDLRMVSIKLMAPIFSAFDHAICRNVIAQHLADVQSLPPSVLNVFKMGGFVVSITGRAWHSVGIDEAHEMLINKSCKTAIVRPTRDYINRVASYMPYRTKCLENLKQQIFPEERVSPNPMPTSILSTNPKDRKAAANTEAQTSVIKSAELLPLTSSNRGLINTFSKKTEQEHDLLQFRSIGKEEFDKHIAYYILRQASIHPPQRKRRLATLSERKPSKRQVSQLERDRRLVQKCLHKKLKWSKHTGKPVDTIAEQYIPIPLALANCDGSPLKGQKSYTTKAFQTRYNDSTPPVIFNTLPHSWIPECCILEGMFMLNTVPLGSHKTFADYAQFLIKRFIVPHFTRGSREVHVIFDNPGRLEETPKQFERKRRDCAATVVAGHACDKFHPNRSIPTKWRENVINCRTCKRSLVIYLTQYFLHHVPKHIQPGKVFVTAGGFEGNIQDSAWFVTSDNTPQPEPAYTCNTEETDTRLWLHVTKTACNQILIISPDTDIYHIGLPLHHGDQKDIIIQINPYNSKDLRYLHMSAFITVLRNDPDLSALPPHHIPQVFQTLFVATGCDYISFFSGMGKATFLRYFYQNAEFISSGRGNTPGTLADVSLDNCMFESGFLAFLRLVGSAYFKKHASGFSTQTPRSHFNKFSDDGTTPLQQHHSWLEDIRQNIWDRVQFENEMIPSTDALYRHWKRTCWVIDMWHQANNNQVVVRPLHDYGWKIDGDSLTFDWDSGENMEAVRQRVAGLLRGCRCRTGCGTSRCGCRRKGKQCSEGCECTNCSNIECTETHTQQCNKDSLLEVTVEEIVTEDRETLTDVDDMEDVDEIIDWVFGDNSYSNSDQESEVEDSDDY